MGAWLESGRLVEAILVLTLVEALVLGLYHARTGRGLAPRDFGPNLVAGMLLLLALREALVRASWTHVAAALIGALVAHVADLAQRWVR